MVKRETGTGRIGVGYAVLAAVLFGASTPVAKLLVGSTPPVILAGLFYLGSGLGLTVLRFAWRTSAEQSVARKDIPWLAGAVIAGGILGPIALMFGLRATSASSASLLLNLEGVFTALLAWFVFHENFDRRILTGMGLIVCGSVILSWQGGNIGISVGAIGVVLACVCWGIDNNLTQKISVGDPSQLAAIKGIAAGAVNLGIGISIGGRLPGIWHVTAALIVGCVGYGLSLALFILALRHIGTARTGAYFSLGPFAGCVVSFVFLHEPLSLRFGVASVFIAVGVWLHLTEKHLHKHTHETMTHSHRHVHDEHHQHSHSPYDPAGEPHAHAHTHEPITHTHAHYPDIHHRHRHSRTGPA